eukprot:TRINITY_DN7177_c0_g1_i4.p1 TRINITY_DN7177_c0_g1~~TRINITY_DN7177_c0_g1_i4.p1  ORF type:complete len:280 (-),score=27.23 TRINITY_DN7177_c0_g1_i4:293-1132(-)
MIIFKQNYSTKREVKILEEIGSGRYGKVFRSKLGGLVCALKVVQMYDLHESVKKSIYREVEITMSLSNPNVINTFAYQIDGKNSVNIFSELWDTSLFSFIDQVKKKDNPKIEFDDFKKVCVDVMSALDYLHNLPNKIIHRDVKSHNILLEVQSNKIRTAVLSDFGSCVQVKNSKPINESVGTARWMAPEVHSCLPYSEKVDIWSFGMMMVELLTLKLPYKDIIVLDVRQAIIDGELPKLDQIQLYYYDKIKPILMQCLNYDPNMRISSTVCLREIVSWV